MPIKNPADCDRLFAKHVGTGDLEALLSLYEEKATFIPNDRSVHMGLARVRKILSGLSQRQREILKGVLLNEKSYRGAVYGTRICCAQEGDLSQSIDIIHK